MPPSPLLLARMMKVMYLIETTAMSDQKIIDNTPSMFKIFSSRILFPIEKISRIEYRGLVPISPKTTPRAAKDRAAVCFFVGLCGLNVSYYSLLEQAKFLNVIEYRDCHLNLLC